LKTSDQNEWFEPGEHCKLAESSVKHGLVEESMRHTLLGAALALSVSAALSLGCGSGAPPAANSFTKVYTEVIQPTCANDYCHYYGVAGANALTPGNSGLDMSSKVRAYWGLFDRPCIGTSCNQMGMRVVPGAPDKSVMYQKLFPAPTLTCGAQMPADINLFLTQGMPTVFSGTALIQENLDLIQNWIKDGAQNN
jgi:hypothetical protein